MKKEYLCINQEVAIKIESAHVDALGDARVIVGKGAIVHAYGKSHVTATSGAFVFSFDDSLIEAGPGAKVHAKHRSRVIAYGESEIWAHDNTSVKASNHVILNLHNFAQASIDETCNATCRDESQCYRRFETFKP